ncbi:hypothetical protein VTL71DRAFT_813 [Oculimacula yallundae]|uniref:Uncharacterized protein n=1 Tax=Oculimacula yallundae TaxID=86028 RepID=A0ABR4D185_9HELO
MKLTHALESLAAIATSSIVSADKQPHCYQEGAEFSTYSNQMQVAGAVDNLCNNGHLSGYFNEGQLKTFCIPLSDNNKHAIAEVRWLGRGGLTLNTWDCRARLGAVFNICYRMGGGFIYADWLFRLDPEDGRC